ncbi:MAG TPA: enoyl-CoA hydratase-related protein [Acidimicrobiales bacterium]|nr:enoyl-CoA hydratase-related protein [Acidimicrobiales bacterium]
MTHDFQHLLYEREGATTTITMNHPERRNALTGAMLEEMIRAFALAGESDTTGVILAGNGPVFCTGHDFTEMLDQDLQSVRRLFATCTKMMDTIQAIPQPVIAKVHALATGAGCQLVATADLAVASHEASFCTPGGRGGLFCTTPMVAVGRGIGRKRALEMAMSGDAIDAATAASWGLVNQVVPASSLDQATNELLARVTRGSTVSKAIGKQAFYAQIDLDQHQAYNYAIEVMAAASQIPDSQEGIRAFIEKRAPDWHQA